MTATRSPVVRVAVQAASPVALTVAAYLLFAGHNRPGGGFAAGLVAGAVVALRMIAGLPTPGRSLTVAAIGGVVAGAVALAPVVGGGVLLDQQVVEWTAPVLGKVKTGSALPFDIGVAAIVVGLVMAVLEGLGGYVLASDEDDAS